MRGPATRWLDALTAACLVAAAAAFLLPVGDAASDDPRGAVPGDVAIAALRDAARSDAPALEARAEPSADSLVSSIVEGNVFSASRRAPNVRFTLPGEAAADAGAFDVVGSSDDVADAAADSGLPRLYGIVSVDGSRRALLELLDGEPPRLLAVGERHAGYTVRAIDADRVRLLTPGGARTLRLAPPPSDPAGDSLRFTP